jgi:hypothetical protein
LFKCSKFATARMPLLQRSPNILLIPGTSSVEHLRENGANGMSDMAGKAAREAVEPSGSERDTMLLALAFNLPHEAIKELNHAALRQSNIGHIIDELAGA